jgi:hypothetical protein
MVHQQALNIGFSPFPLCQFVQRLDDEPLGSAGLFSDPGYTWDKEISAKIPLFVVQGPDQGLRLHLFAVDLITMNAHKTNESL